MREYELPFTDGNIHLVQGTTFIVNDSEGVAMGIGTIEIDITDARQIETQLRQAQKMEALGQLTGGVAHDFNNLLAVVSGNLELLDEALEGDEKKRELLRWALNATDDAVTLTRHLLAFSRQQPLDPRTVYIDDLVTNLLTMLRRPLCRFVNIETDLSEDRWPTTVDPSEFGNALLNLVLNARDAMPDGGVIMITTANISLTKAYVRRNSDATDGDFIKLSIIDSGKGFTPEVQEHAFEPFFTTKEVGKGSGLGLSMVYGFSKQSGGHVDIVSKEGRGSTVSIYPPRATEPVAPTPEVEDPVIPPGKGEMILVVDGDSGVRDAARRDTV